AVISGRVGNHITLSFRKTSQLGILDQIQRMLVMRFMRDVISHIMKQGSSREQGTLMSIQIMRSVAQQIIKNPFCQPRHLMSVRLFVTKASANSMDPAQTIVGKIGQ